MSRGASLWLCLALLGFSEPRPQRAADPFHEFQFSDRLPESGITFVHHVVDDVARHYRASHYAGGSGLPVADVDGDGLTDLYFANQVGGGELWRNAGRGRFEDITQRSGVALPDRIGVSGSFADIDNDGDPDLFVTTVRDGNVLFENDGRGHFTDITGEAGVGAAAHSSGAVFFDYDRDGRLDLFVCNVGRYTDLEAKGPDGEYVALPDAFEGPLHPDRFEYPVLYKNEGRNRFQDVSEALGLRPRGWCGDASVADLNGDVWPDLYVLNMHGDDHYYENQAGKGFIEKTSALFPKAPPDTRGIKFFDHDNDGRLDLVLGGALYHNAGAGRLEESSGRLGVDGDWPWGVSAGDLNADGWEDLFVTSGRGFPFPYAANSLLLNDHGEKFLEAASVLGVEPRRDGRTRTPWFELDCAAEGRDEPTCQGQAGRITVQAPLSSRGSAIFDLDDDGDLDVVTNEFGAEPMLLVSNLAERRPLHWLKVVLTGTASNRNGLGAIVRVRAAGKTYTKPNDGKSGYLSQSVLPLYFGLGDAGKIDRVEVDWPSGRRQVVKKGLRERDTLRLTEPK